MNRVARAVAVVVLAGLGPALPLGTAAGSEDIWQRAAVPRLARDRAVYRLVETMLVRLQELPPSGGSRAMLLDQAERLLRDARADQSPDIRVRAQYGRVLELLTHLGADDDRQGTLARSESVLEQTIALDPDHPVAIDARYALAIAYARLGKPRKEIEVYDALLDRETSPERRATVLCNQAEAYMILGELDRAITGYRASVRLGSDNPLPHWGLAVALDRSGDPDQAIAEVNDALRQDPEARQLHGPDVFFVPAYDRFWYDALGAMARARNQKGAPMAALWWKEAEMHWGRYIDAAAPDDRWTRIAHSRSEMCARIAKEQSARALRQRRPWVFEP